MQGANSRAGAAAPGSTALAAVIFDVDGTLADTERDGHRVAFNEAFARHGLGFSWSPEEYGRLLAVTGGARRLEGDLRERGFGARAAEVAAEVHATKTALFRERVVRGLISPRPGVPALVDGLRAAGIRIAIATTGRRAWVAPLVDALLGAGQEGGTGGAVEVMVTGESVARLKPDPEAYETALRELGIGPDQALAIEDSAVGVRAAVGAGIATVAVTNGYTVGQDFRGAVAVLPAFDGAEPLTAARCVELHHQAQHQALHAQACGERRTR